MQEKNILLCFLAMPLRHKVIAAGIAVAIGSGFFLWSRNGMRPATTAEVSFDAGVARLVEPVAMQAKQPAVALALLILSDEAVRGLADRTGVSGDVMEVRSRLKMTQSSPKLLEVNYREGDKELSAAMANAVANLLVAWRPAHIIAPEMQAEVSPPPHITKSHRSKKVARSQSDEIRNLEAQLAATDQKLAALSVPRKTDAIQHVSTAESEQRRLLELQLNAAQKKLENLRVRYTDEYPDVENAKENIADIQQQLASLRPVDNESEQSATPWKKDNDSSQLSQLHQERARLVQAITEEKRREETLQGRTATALVESTVQPGQTSVHDPVSSVAPVLQSPFTLVRLASYRETISPWHGVLAGILCGLLYLSSAVWRYLPIGNGMTRERLTRNNDSAAGIMKDGFGTADFESLWEREIREAIALTDIGREEEALTARSEALAGQQRNDSSSGITGQLHYDEVSEAIREKIKREPNSWMAHTEEARIALTSGDFDKAIQEIRLAMTIAPEKMKPQLDKIIAQLDKNVSMKQA
jgi:hypothetical protein